MALKAIDICCQSCDWTTDLLVERGPEEEQTWTCPECGGDAKKGFATPIAARTRQSRTYLDGQRAPEFKNAKEAYALQSEAMSLREKDRAPLMKEAAKLLSVKKQAINSHPE